MSNEEEKSNKNSNNTENKSENEEDQEIIVSNFRGSPKVLQISKGNYYYLINREKYDITKIMMLIDYNKLSTLGQKFKEYEEGIEKIIFCTLLTNILKSEKMPINDLNDLIYGIYKFFAEIDFNGDNNMEWAEFTQFIIDKVEGEHNIAEDEKTKDANALSEKEIMKYKRYEISQKIRDFHIHKSDIIKAWYMTKSGKLIINEYNTHILRVYNPYTGHTYNNLNIHSLNDHTANNKFKDIKKMLDQNKTFSIISFTAFDTVVAVLLSNRYILFFYTFNFKDCDLIFAIKTKTLQKRIWYLENHNMWLTSGDKEKEDEFFFVNELDVKFEVKAGYPNPISRNLGYKTRYCVITQHKNEIYDVIEIKKPFLMLTACLDGYIRLINTKDLEFLKTWKYHASGVKHLDFNPNLESSGYILSTGFEYNINLYCTDLSLDSAFKGKLEGHFLPLVDCKFINNSPFCASVDEEGNIRIWDAVLKICLQSIPNIRKNIVVNGLLIMHKINKFIIYGNNLTFFDSKYKEDRDDPDDLYEENHPIKICYNKYYQQFYVASMVDIKIYDKYGNLIKKFKRLLEDEHFETGTKIRDFIFDINYRKFYIGFSNGAIIQYNAGNGSAIKVINQIEYERNGILYYKYHHTRDISNIYYYYSKNDLDQETILLFSTSLDSTIQIYDERDYDNSIKLKTYLNAHTVNKRKNEIVSMDYNYYLSQLATGSVYGVIVIWNFNNMKINDIYYLNSKIWGARYDVVTLKYLDKYPLLFSSFSEGICIIWTVKPLKGEPILKFQNFYQTLYKLDVCEVTCCCFYDDLIQDFNKEYLNIIYFVDEPKYIEERNKERIDKITGEVLPKLSREHIEKKSETDKTLDPNNINNENNDNNKSYYLLICDKKGYMKVLNLSGIFSKYVSSFEIEQDQNANFSLLKKEDVDVGEIKQHLLKISQVRQENDFEKLYTNLYSSHIISKEWRGHTDSITSLEFLDDPLCTITISKDKLMHIWDEKFELIGEINLFADELNNTLNRNLREKKVEWKFKVNEKKLIEKEVAEFVRILENIEINEETKIFKGSQIDLDFNDPNKYEIDEKEGLIPKREKIIIEEEKIAQPEYTIKINTNANEVKDDSEFQSNYEAIMLKNLALQIDLFIKNEPAKEGIGELSNNLMNSLIENKAKLAKLKKLKMNDFNRLSNPVDLIEKRIDKRRESLFSKKKPSTNKSNLVSENQDEPYKIKDTNLISNEKQEQKTMNIELKKSVSQSIKRDSDSRIIIKKDSDNKVKRASDIDILRNSKTMYGAGLKTIDIDISNKIKPEEKPLAKTTKCLLRKTFSHINITAKGSKNSSFIHKARYSLKRNNLYAEKFLYKSFYNPKEKGKEKEKEKNDFPKISTKYSSDRIKYERLSDKLKYVTRKKIDDLIKTQYYFNNYKNCFKMRPNYSDLTSNKSNLYNFKNMWNDIKSYTKDFMSKEKNRKSFNFNAPFKKLYKSNSASDIRAN